MNKVLVLEINILDTHVFNHRNSRSHQLILLNIFERNGLGTFISMNVHFNTNLSKAKQSQRIKASVVSLPRLCVDTESPGRCPSSYSSLNNTVMVNFLHISFF
jgi:hypothetical protein